MPAPIHMQPPALVFAALGALSGVVSSLNAATVLPALNAPAFYYGLPPDHLIPLWPAIAFGVALALGAFIILRPPFVTLLGVMASVMAGWWVVMEYAALPVFTAEGLNPGAPLLYGFTGAFILAIGCMLSGLYSRHWTNLALISLVGAVAGLLMLVDVPGLWLLFVGWQAAVGAAVGHALTRSVRQPIAADGLQHLKPGE